MAHLTFAQFANPKTGFKYIKASFAKKIWAANRLRIYLQLNSCRNKMFFKLNPTAV